MKEQEISFKTSKLALEKGCRETIQHYDVYGRYNDSGVFSYSYTEPDYSEEFPAPTQSLLQKWLRENQEDWSILVYVVPFFSQQPRQEQCFIWRRGELIVLEPESTYEKALEIGLYKALKLIEINK